MRGLLLFGMGLMCFGSGQVLGIQNHEITAPANDTEFHNTATIGVTGVVQFAFSGTKSCTLLLLDSSGATMTSVAFTVSSSTGNTGVPFAQNLVPNSTWTVGAARIQLHVEGINDPPDDEVNITIVDPNGGGGGSGGSGGGSGGG